MSTRIYIIGCLGSGKSFFAKELSRKIGIEYFEMDRIVFNNSTFEERTKEERDRLFETLIKKENWILEGTFTEDWVLLGLEGSSQVVYLATPSLVRLYRFIKRIIKQGILNQDDLLGRVRLVLGFRYKEWDRTASKYEQILKPYKDKVVTLKSKREMQNFIYALEGLK